MHKIDYNKFFIYTENLLKMHNCKNVKLLRMKSSDAVSQFTDESIDLVVERIK